MTSLVNDKNSQELRIPWFGARRLARELATSIHALRAELDKKTDQLSKLTIMGRQLVEEVKELRSQRESMLTRIDELGLFSIVELEAKKQEVEREIAQQTARMERERAAAATSLAELTRELQAVRAALVETDELSLLQEVGVYQYRHPLTDAVSYQKALSEIESAIKSMVKKDGGAVLATTSWLVNDSVAQGRKMVSDFSKLMLRAFNAEADNLVRGMKPFKLDSALDRLAKTSETIARLGKTMNIRISEDYYQLRVREFELTSDFLQKQAEEKEIERAERERMREERKAQQEIERERVRLEKERKHYTNAIEALVRNGDETAADRLRKQLTDVDQALQDIDYRAANIRAGYVYVISNVGSFGERMVKIGMTRRLDPMDRIRELSDASVPFNFDVHAVFFSKDAVAIEAEMHTRFSSVRVNAVNRRREFFRASPSEVKRHLGELAGELLEFTEVPEALEYRQSLLFESQSAAIQ